ncbi:MAG: type II toxin-antitoxin system RelE/ParE family toxin [Candidatus Marinimicrobia bacterium]|nr:type II toxin-antitoxin system RelE/ParE family toxin [Candidatus Neomarinimicrobiota bacterium]MCH7763682.1 type II toxin-antitoxin system RelE/ParE family toxin [Candidatus Neomarinimicrobiota bacterium]
MSYKIQIEKHVLKQIAILPKPFKNQIKSFITVLSENPRPTGIKKLQSSKSIYRQRKGKYRIIFFINDKNEYVKILKVGHRKNVY